MKILYVTTISNTLNAFLIPHIDMLINDGHEVSVACAIEQPLKPFFYENNIKIFQIPISRTPFARENVRAYKEIKKLVKQNQFDIVHTHTPVASMITRLACKNLNTRVFYTAHGFHFYKGASKFNWFFYYPVEKYLSQYTDTLITINNEDYQLASNKFLSKRVFLVNGVGLPIDHYEKEVDKIKKREDLGVNEVTKIILSVGELNDNKNHALVINALSEFKEQDFKYFICGIGPLKNKLGELIKEAGLEDKVKLLGYRTDIIEIMKVSDLFVFPSKREGLPVSVMEAMANGLPVVGSNIRGNSDLIDNKIDGELFDLYDLNELQRFFTRFFSGNVPLNYYTKNATRKIYKYSQLEVLNKINLIYSQE